MRTLLDGGDPILFAEFLPEGGEGFDQGNVKQGNVRALFASTERDQPGRRELFRSNSVRAAGEQGGHFP